VDLCFEVTNIVEAVVCGFALEYLPNTSRFVVLLFYLNSPFPLVFKFEVFKLKHFTKHYRFHCPKVFKLVNGNKNTFALLVKEKRIRKYQKLISICFWHI